MKKAAVFLPIFGVLLTGCAPVVVGGVAAAGYIAAQERGAQAVMTDTKIKTHIKDKLTAKHYTYLTKVEVTVLQGDVFLTGVLSSPQEAAEVERIARSVPDVKNVYNDLFSDGVYPATQYSKDSFVSTQVRGRFLSAKDVYSINYFVRVVNGNVYLIGLAGSQSEMERALHLARTTKGVQKVVNYIRLYEGDIRIESGPDMMADPNPVDS